MENIYFLQAEIISLPKVIILFGITSALSIMFLPHYNIKHATTSITVISFIEYHTDIIF